MIFSKYIFKNRRLDIGAIQQSLVNWAIILSGLLFYNGLNALTLIVVARRVTPVEYGQYLASYALVSFLVVLPSFGMDAWLLTQHHATPKSAAALWISSLRSKGQLLIFWLIGMALLGMVLPAKTFSRPIFLPTVIGVALDSLTLLSMASLRSQNRHGQVTLLQSISSIILFAITLILPITDGYIVRFAVSRTVLSFLVAAVVVGYLGKEYWRKSLTLTPTREILVSSRSFMFAELASSVYVKADLTIISLILGSVGTGVYGPAINLLQASFMAPKALFFLMVPILSKTYIKQRSAFINKGIAQLVVQLFVGLTISIVTFFFASEIVGFVFKEAYQSSADILRLLSPIPFLRSLNFALGAVLTSSNRQSPRSKIQVFIAILNLIGNLVVIIPWGLAGVSIVYVLSELFLFIGYGLLLLRDAILLHRAR
ncbi:MAG: oligosaccharide flippase family protein [Ardenticatenaceae bacterium]